MQLSFGPGALWGNRTDVTGSGIGPDQFAILQDCQTDFDFQVKELYGANQFAVDAARGTAKLTVKAKYARIFGSIYGDLVLGATPAVGQLTVSQNEPATVPATSAYTVTVSNAANYVDDLGVFYATGANAGARFTRVSAPAGAGQYSVNLGTGIYTFSAADASAALLISYQNNKTGSGKQIAITNQLAGFTPTFKATLYTQKMTFGVAAGSCLVLNRCTATKMSLPRKIDDYEIGEIDFMAMDDGTGNVGVLSVNE